MTRWRGVPLAPIWPLCAFLAEGHEHTEDGIDLRVFSEAVGRLSLAAGDLLQRDDDQRPKSPYSGFTEQR